MGSFHVPKRPFKKGYGLNCAHNGATYEMLLTTQGKVACNLEGGSGQAALAQRNCHLGS